MNTYSYPDGGNYDELIKYDENSPKWHIGQCYDPGPARQIKCRKCGSNQFYVGIGSYWVGIKCINCKYELNLSDG